MYSKHSRSLLSFSLPQATHCNHKHCKIGLARHVFVPLARPQLHAQATEWYILQDWVSHRGDSSLVTVCDASHEKDNLYLYPSCFPPTNPSHHPHPTPIFSKNVIPKFCHKKELLKTMHLSWKYFGFFAQTPKPAQAASQTPKRVSCKACNLLPSLPKNSGASQS